MSDCVIRSPPVRAVYQPRKPWCSLSVLLSIVQGDVYACEPRFDPEPLGMYTMVGALMPLFRG